MPEFGPLVSPEWLNDHLHDPDLRVVDLRWYLDGRSGRAAYEGGHIPGAVFVDLESELSRRDGPGRHPLPERGRFAAAMRRAGVGRSTRVVGYDDVGGSVAARLWWLLRHFGHRAQAILDGGIRVWPGELEPGTNRVPPGDFSAARPRPGELADFEAVRDRPDGVLVLDARLPKRYRGEEEPVDPRAGHIPGARSAFWRGNLDAGGRFLDPGSLRRHYAELGVDDGRRVIAQCGSGVNACHLVLALELAGLPGGRLYEGSWSDWSRRDAPLATGPEP